MNFVKFLNKMVGFHVIQTMKIHVNCKLGLAIIARKTLKPVISTGIRISGYPNPEYLPESEITYPSTESKL